jgi:hypothetical protein
MSGSPSVVENKWQGQRDEGGQGRLHREREERRQVASRYRKRGRE